MKRRNGPDNGRRFTVSGPGADERKTHPSERVGISYALTLANLRSRLDGNPGTWYVRNEDGELEARVELDQEGVIRAHALGSYML